jgi:hypothetical protein
VYGARAEPEDYAKLSLPNPMDTQELANFKARVRARHETFNMLLSCMDQTWYMLLLL